MSKSFSESHASVLKEIQTETGQEVENVKLFGVGDKKCCVICRSYENQTDMSLLAYFQQSQLVPKMLGMEREREHCFTLCSHAIHSTCFEKHEEVLRTQRRTPGKFCPLCGATYNARIPNVSNIKANPKLVHTHRSSHIDFDNFFSYWENVEIMRKDSLVEPKKHINIEHIAKFEDEMRAAAKLSHSADLHQVLTNALHWCIKGDEGSCRVKVPSQDKFCRLFSTINSVVVSLWMKEMTNRYQENVGTRFWKNVWYQNKMMDILEIVGVADPENIEERNHTMAPTMEELMNNNHPDNRNTEEEDEVEDMSNEIILGDQRIDGFDGGQEINEEMLRELLENEEIVMGPADLLLQDGSDREEHDADDDGDIIHMDMSHMEPLKAFLNRPKQISLKIGSRVVLQKLTTIKGKELNGLEGEIITKKDPKEYNDDYERWAVELVESRETFVIKTKNLKLISEKTTNLLEVDPSFELLNGIIGCTNSFILSEDDQDEDESLETCFILNISNDEPIPEFNLYADDVDLGCIKDRNFVISIPSNTKHLCIGKNNRKLIDPSHLVPSNDIHYLYTENCDIYYQIQQQSNPESDQLQKILQSCYIIQIFQSLIASCGDEQMDKFQKNTEESCTMLDIHESCRGPINQEKMEQSILPFLKYATLVWHGLRIINVSPNDIWPGNLENLLSTLSLPHFMEILTKQSHPILTNIYSKYVQIQEIKALDKNLVPALATLPETYGEIFQAVSEFSRDKKIFICLICGGLIAFGDSRPAATFLKQHSKDCVGCTGMFLSTKQKHATKILMAQKNQYAYLNSPYVDKFGCTDHGLRRGTQLHLDEERYQYLRDIAISREIQNKVLHRF